MKELIGIIFAIFVFAILASVAKNKRFCFAVGFDWTTKKPLIWARDGRDYASVWASKAGMDAHFQNMVNEYKTMEKK